MFLRRSGEGQRILWKARSAITRSGVEEFTADPIVQTHAVGDCLHIASYLFAKVRNLIDEGDFRG